MVNTFRALAAIGVTASAVALTTAAPAQASAESYLKPLMARFVFLSPQQLLTAGYKVCQAEKNGTNSADASNMLQKDLGLSVAASVEIVSAAVINLC
ncbi:MAG: hypothetical protein QOH60_2695 [Mycobacterium sp.]|nr:hypothetical protein [Mycobacterium sp.]